MRNWTSLPPSMGSEFLLETAETPTSLERDSQCGNSQCRPSKLETPLDLLRFWLDVEWDLKSAAHSCTAVNGMTTHGLGSRVKL